MSLFFFLAVSFGLMAQSSTESLLRQADSLRREYEFEKSVELCRKALETERDSLSVMRIEDLMLLSENGLSMSDYICCPTVVARHRFSLDDFFLYYPFRDRTWRPSPNVLDPDGSHPYAKAVYVEDDAEEIFFSARDKEGSMNIYKTSLLDSVWSTPALLNEDNISSADEIFPVLSEDGQKLWYASSGLFGMGGYDIYVTRWDAKAKDWTVPENLGFPFSSPYNDYLYMDTPDGKYTLFASDRESPADSVDVYVLEYDPMPLRRQAESAEEIRALSHLEPVIDPSRMDYSSGVDADEAGNDDIRRYKAQMDLVRILKDSIYNCSVALDNERNAFALSDDDDERAIINASILRREYVLPLLQDSLKKHTALLQEIEMQFLFSGVVIDPDKVNRAADREVVGTSEGYAFKKMGFGPALEMAFEKVEPEYDYTLNILPQGRFAEDNTLPSGIVYQIQIFTISTKAKVRQLRGLSPVFEHKTPTGKYTYCAGLFRTYKDVLANLNKVKKAGFKTAFIVAYKDGKSIPVKQARAEEK
ncbi:MAG: hypothetical protein ACI4TM_03365 [Candidatus Cryptobacteroides sp.]